MDTIYRNTRAWRARFLQLVFWGFTAAMAWLAWTSRSEDTANLLVATLTLTAFGAACAIGIEVYLRLYVTMLRASAQELAIETLSTIGRTTQTYPMAQVVRGRMRRSNPTLTAAATGFYLDNAWSTLRVHGRRLPFIVDATP